MYFMKIMQQRYCNTLKGKVNGISERMWIMCTCVRISWGSRPTRGPNTLQWNIGLRGIRAYFDIVEGREKISFYMM